MKQRLPKDPTK